MRRWWTSLGDTRFHQGRRECPVDKGSMYKVNNGSCETDVWYAFLAPDRQGLDGSVDHFESPGDRMTHCTCYSTFQAGGHAQQWGLGRASALIA